MLVRKTRGQNTTKWFDILLEHMISVSRQNGYTVIQEVIYEDDDLRHSILETSGGYVDAVVLFYLVENDKRVEMAARNHIPCISFEKSGQVNMSVSNNNRKGILDAAEFLFKRNLTRICLLLGAVMPVNTEREKALIEAYQQFGIPAERLEVVYHMNELEKIKQFADGKIEQGQLPEVFFVSGDEKALAIYQSLYNHGLAIPRDVSVIGFDNIPISRYYSPALTTVGQNFEELAKQIFAAIGKLLNGDPDVTPVEVDPQLFIRDSVK